MTFGEATEVASEGNDSDLDCFTAPQERQLLIAVFFVLHGTFPLAAPAEQRTLNRAAIKGEHRQRCRAPRPICTEPFKSFSALDNHPLFAVY